MKTDIEFTRGRKGITFELDHHLGNRTLAIKSWIAPKKDSGLSVVDEWDRHLLLGKSPLSDPPCIVNPLRIVDLFCGAGGFTEGIKQGLRSMGISSKVVAACDIDRKALDIYGLNHAPEIGLASDLNTYIDYSLRRKSEYDMTFSDVRFAGHDLKALEYLIGGCDILIAGPPCQGHSNLNNHSRRNDPRNNLYISVAAYAALLKPKLIAIENVQSVIHDKASVVDRTKSLLEGLGYEIEESTINGVHIGMAQTRKRHFLIAKQDVSAPLNNILEAYRYHYPAPRPLSWCLDIAPSIYDCENSFYLPSTLSDENQQRVDWLFMNNEYDLPNTLRPVCHQKEHNYKSIYGRLKWDLPSGTITTGFHSPGRGRYIHPKERRVLTACEASLIQGFPLSYRFFSHEINHGRNLLAKVIGDAVSPQMARVIGQNFGLEIYNSHLRNVRAA